MTNQLKALFTNTANLQLINQNLPAFVSLLLVIACAHALANITWMFLPDNDSSLQQVSRSSKPVTRQPSQRQAIMAVANAHLFGEMKTAALPQQTKAPETKLNLVLRGVIAADPMKLSHAIIARGKKGKEEVYAVGEKMPGGITIESIYPDHVILNRGGRLETLQLIKDEDVGKITTAKKGGGFLPPGTAAEQLVSVREQILQNPTSFGDYAIPVVVKQKGKQIGYRLQPQQKGTELMQQVGLKANDVITEINGIKLDNPQNSLGALSQLRSASSVSITVMRNGTKVPLSIQLQ